MVGQAEEKASEDMSSDAMPKVTPEGKPTDGRPLRGSPPMQQMPGRPPSAQGGSIGTNTRPSSAMSNASAGGPPRGTVTSRRGGRTRSRSPATSMSRPGSATGPIEQHPAAAGAADGRQSPGNPSSAAAAAAAAAKAITTGSGRPSWYGDGDDPNRGQPDTGRYQHGYEFGGSRNWPGEMASRDRRAYAGGHPPHSSSRDMGDDRVHIQYSRRNPHDRTADAYGHPSHRHPTHPNDHNRYYDRRMEYDSRYVARRDHYDLHGGSGRNRSSDSRASPAMGPPPGSYDDRQRYDSRRGGPTPEDYYKAAMEKDGGQKYRSYSPKTTIPTRDHSSAPHSVKRSGGHSRVMGTPTPIHVPRAADPPRQTQHQQAPHPPQQPHMAGTPASVFRGRPPNEDPARRPPEDDSAQKILMSLRTPTTSFEEREGSKTAENRKKQAAAAGNPPLSPEEPPQIQHSHQGQIDSNIFFEKSPGNPANTSGATLEMAPSFSLFNQSFDSLGDAANYLTSVGGPLDIQSNSFGAPLGASTDNNDSTAQLLPDTLQRNGSLVGERNGSFLGSSSGMLTFGMSPVNSFGNGAPSSSTRRGSSNNNTNSSNSGGNNMMVLGGPEARPASPNQMLNVHPTYSTGYGSQGSGHPQPFRTRSQNGDYPARSMSNGSGFGGSNAYNRSFDTSPRVQYHGHMPQDTARPFDGPPGFYVFLATNKGAFIGCTFLLPGLKAAMLESPIGDSKKHDDKAKSKKPPMLRSSRYPEPSPQDTEIAKRRVTSAVCAFGGSISGDRGMPMPKEPAKDTSQSIFREKEEKVATVTPSSSAGSATAAGNRSSSREKMKYDEMLPTRYYENENRLSWEFEETPPVGIMDQEEESRKRKRPTSAEPDSTPSNEDTARMASPSPKTTSNQVSEGKKSGKDASPGDQPKMRYRCKLCGQPKQNHTCPYQQSLQRSIGTMVYPAVNAFTSNEPGLLAPTLTDMNNFIATNDPMASSAESSPNRPTPDRRRGASASTPGGSGATNVTPETLRSTGGSPGGSSLSTGSGSPQRTPYRSPSSKRKREAANLSGGAAMSRRVGSPPGSHGRGRHHPHMAMAHEDNVSDLLFVDAADLKPEQFRIVSPNKVVASDSYTYPALPLPYAQRKRLSDNLFALSKEVPQLTDECAVVLREAREKDMWDLAVAELMTQVVVVLHCRDGDSRFEGLRRYLLSLGIAC